MRVAFYAPMKPPDHPVPSGDRRMARAFMALLARASATRSSWPADSAATIGTATPPGSSGSQRLGARLAARLSATPAAAEQRRSCGSPITSITRRRTGWGPSSARRCAIPYVVAEASLAGKQARGPWAAGYAASRAAIAQADLVLAMTEQDLPGLPGRGRARAAAAVPAVPGCGARSCAASRHARCRPEVPDACCAVAMMRADVKLPVLPHARRRPARGSTTCRGAWCWSATARRGRRSRRCSRRSASGCGWSGALPPAALPEIYAAADLYVWPACNEAYGMALLEAQAAGRAGGRRSRGRRARHRRRRRPPGCSTEPRSPPAFAAGRPRAPGRPGAPARHGRVRRRRVCWRGTIWRRRAAQAGGGAGRSADAGMRICLIRHGSTALERGRPHPGSDRHPAERSAGGRRSAPGGCRRASPVRPA